jgi:RNA polymerase sigma-70 factor (ECF subfamily)
MVAPMSDGDAALVRRTLEGDRQAFSVLVGLHLPRARAIARAVLEDHAEADDAVQTAFLRAWERLGQLADAEGFAAWLGQIVRREAIDRLRRRERLGERPLPPSDPPAPLASEDDPRLERLRAALARLGAGQREILALRYEAGLGYEDIAATLGLSLANVEKRLYRARQALLELMEGG